MTKISKSLLIGLPLFFVACINKPMSKDELRQYIDNTRNGLVIIDSNSSNGLKIKIMLVRPELLFDTLPKKAKINDSLKYFLINFTKNGREALAQAGNQSEYASLLENLSFEAPKYCRLIVDKKDTVQLNNYSFSNAYGTAAGNNLLLVFKAPVPAKKYDLNLDELGFHTGEKHYSFNKDDISNLYNIKIK